MKRLIALAVAACLAAPALAQQTPADVRTAADAEARAFMTGYVQAFNKGDAGALSRDFYAVPGKSREDVYADLIAGYAALRAEEWGKMNLFGFKTCVGGAGAVEVQMDYEYQFTYGGAMPPGDRMTVFSLKKTEQGWRIAATRDLAPGQMMACPV